MHRRSFITSAVSLAAQSRLGFASLRALSSDTEAEAPVFTTSNARWQTAYDKALRTLAGNVQVLPRFNAPVLIEGSAYAGIWQECGPHEALVYGRFRPDVARNSHNVFFALQRPDGQLPANNKRTEAGFGQIQMVVPIAATAWELAQANADDTFLAAAYLACSRWDAWLVRTRNTRATGLIEGFCTYDTGMDNSPRWAGMPLQCPGKDAAVCPSVPGLPRLCPDLSATVYGARVALAAIASALGKPTEGQIWTDRAEQLRGLILRRLFAPDDAAFYDLDAHGNFVRIRCDILSRVCGEHVVDQRLFDTLWGRQLGNPSAFWAPFPLPSVALDDPAFVRPIPRNSWGGAAQALTGLRAARWMEHYRRSAEFAHLMQQWTEALQRDMTFRQQLDPQTGEFTQGDLPNYSPACLLMYDFTWRLAGVHEQGDEIWWNVRPGTAASDRATFRVKLGRTTAEMRYTGTGAHLSLNGREIAQIAGTARLITDHAGKPLALLGVGMTSSTIRWRTGGNPECRVRLEPNQRLAVRSS